MRKVVLSMFQSLDGYVEGLGGQFVGPKWSDDLDRWTQEMIQRFDTLVYGSVSFRQMAAYWPAAEADGQAPTPHRELARFMNRTRKIVFSRNFDIASTWENSERAASEPGSVLSEEKARAGRDLVVFAGARMAQSAMRAGVVDEWSLLTLPVFFGGGTRLFVDHQLAGDLRLVEVRPMDTGAVLTRYVRS